MKWIKNLEDFKEYIFENKERVSRRKSELSNAEAPRVVYNRTCLQIAEKLSDIGFKYFPNQHKLRLDNHNGNFSLIINFSSSPYNSRGKYVELQFTF